MPIGDKQAAVRACVNKVLTDHGAPPPIDPNGTMDKTYHYAKQNMYSFHRQVKICLNAKGYTYKYEESDAYMLKTVSMTVLKIYTEVSVKTKAKELVSTLSLHAGESPRKPAAKRGKKRRPNRKKARS